MTMFVTVSEMESGEEYMGLKVDLRCYPGGVSRRRADYHFETCDVSENLKEKNIQTTNFNIKRNKCFKIKSI
jgi:hypothetical protein